jgi:GNAT superfamily N-acetyltransferase
VRTGLVADGTPRSVLHILVVDPAYQRRGIGSLLVKDGVGRAHALGLPVLLSASPVGTHLYPKLGFKTLDAPIVTRAEIRLPIMLKEP